jgi:hypothetical protein
MSYSLIEIPKENYLRLITDSTPLYIPMGALSAADATTLIVGLVVGIFGGTSATITMEESFDAGATYAAVPAFTADVITGIGLSKIKLDPSNGPLSPVVRVKVEAAAGTTLYLSRVFRTFVQSSVMVPRDVTLSSNAATEATQIQVLAELILMAGYIDGLETLVASTNTKLDTLHTDIATTVVGHIDGIETLIGTTNTNVAAVTTRLNQMGSALFTKAYDELDASVDATHDYYVTKLATVTQQTLTITYSDATKDTSTANYKVV